MRVFVTGGAGFFGANLVHCLARSGKVEEVVCADLGLPDEMAARYLAPVADRVQAVRLDVTDRTAFIRLVAGHRITHLIHAAAITPDDAEEKAQPDAVVDINLGGSINALSALAQCSSVERLILVSSSGVYGAAGALVGGDSPGSSQSEDGPLHLANLYAITKRCAELLGERYAALLDRPVTAVRLGPLYGPLERASRTRPHTTALHRLAAALAEKRSVRVAGPDIVRDWTYAGDAAEAVLGLLLTDRWSSPVYNVSCGVGYPFREVVAAFEAHGLQIAWVASADEANVAMRPAQARTPLDITRLHEDTGFHPRHDLAAGIGAYVRFISDGVTS
jgi:nucleoside-diphosphate-sugar epimerase